MKPYRRPLPRLLGELFLLAILALLPAVAVYIDLAVLGQKTGEKSVTEISQAVILLFTILICWRASQHYLNERGAFVLMVGFFTCALIREMDAVFDLVWHGFWVIPAIVVTVACIAYALVILGWRPIAESLIKLAHTREMTFIFLGLITLLVLSRTFGSGNLIWNDVLPQGIASTFKSALQEGLELYGYIYILYGSFRFSSPTPAAQAEQ